MYHFDERGRTRVFEDHPTSKWGYGGATLQLSGPDSQGRRLLLTHYMSVQCASAWMGMAYSVYRLRAFLAALANSCSPASTASGCRWNSRSFSSRTS